MTRIRQLLLLLLLSQCFAQGGVAAADRPNVVLVFIDDMGWGDFSAFGNDDADTPQFDRMAAEGLAFEQFYVNSPICSPSRVAISTGQYPQRWRITSYLARRELNAKRGMADWLDPAAPMLARELQRSGYATGHFGKWHMGGQRDVADAPEISAYGFDESLTNFEGMGAKLLPLTQDDKGTLGRIWDGAVILGEPVTWMQRSQITRGFVDAAIDFMDRARAEDRPFYINLWPDDVHSPYWPPPEDYGVAKEAGTRGLYLAVLESMDRQFGRLFDYLRSDEILRRNTVVVICSDNGPDLHGGSAGPFKGFKTHLFEGGIRSPLIVWAPGFLPANQVGGRNTESVIAAIDLAPSLMTLTRTTSAEVPPWDGKPMLDTLLGRSRASRPVPIFFSRPPDRKNYYEIENLPDLAVRDGRWKLLCDYDGGRPLLHDMEVDRGETSNVASDHPGVTQRLVAAVRAWHAEVSPSHRIEAVASGKVASALPPSWSGQFPTGTVARPRR